MLLNIKNEIDKLISNINAVASVDTIYIFGSFAYGQPTEDSDIDLCIVTKDNTIRKRDLIKSIRKSISQVAFMPVDILVYHREEFLNRAMLESTFENKIAREGVRVYEQ